MTSQRRTSQDQELSVDTAFCLSSSSSLDSYGLGTLACRCTMVLHVVVSTAALSLAPALYFLPTKFCPPEKQTLHCAIRGRRRWIRHVGFCIVNTDKGHVDSRTNLAKGNRTRYRGRRGQSAIYTGLCLVDGFFLSAIRHSRSITSLDAGSRLAHDAPCGFWGVDVYCSMPMPMLMLMPKLELGSDSWSSSWGNSGVAFEVVPRWMLRNYISEGGGGEGLAGGLLAEAGLSCSGPGSGPCPIPECGPDLDPDPDPILAWTGLDWTGLD